MVESFHSLGGGGAAWSQKAVPGCLSLESCEDRSELYGINRLSPKSGCTKKGDSLRSMHPEKRRKKEENKNTENRKKVKVTKLHWPTNIEHQA